MARSPLHHSSTVRVGGPTSAPLGSRGARFAAALALVACVMLSPGDAVATRITSAGDAALTGALIQNFDAATADSYFTSQTFLIGTNGFTVAPLSGSLHIDNVFCANFGTSGNCLDTMTTGGAGNDDFNVTFTGTGVTAFGFNVNALDIDWTVTTYGAGNVLLGTYVINSQSPGLSGDLRRGYFGATETSRIQSFQIRSTTGSDRVLIDNFAYVVTPEPSSAVLLGLGLVGLTLAGSRRSPIAY